MSAIQAVKEIFTNFSARGLCGWLGGRSFLIVVFFSVTGFWLADHGKLSGSYAALASALTGFHIVRAVGEDKFGNCDRDLNKHD
ncbi:MAG: hypothetical protein ACREQ5_12775 [Candidatus Dormibacteria bacterium]